MRKKQTIKEWEIETGIRVNNPKGFRGRKSNIWNIKYTSEAFRLGLVKSIISIKTQKGLDFINGQTQNDEQWKSYMDYLNNRRDKNNRNYKNINKHNRRISYEI